jgi:hypothetical protein
MQLALWAAHRRIPTMAESLSVLFSAVKQAKAGGLSSGVNMR